MAVGGPAVPSSSERHPGEMQRVRMLMIRASREVRALLSGWCPRGLSLSADLLAGAKGVAALIRVTEGNFRLRERLLSQVGRILAIKGLEVMTREVLVIGAA